MSLYKSPWARVFTYRGHRIKRNGQPSKQEVVCYPHDTSLHSNQSDQYMPVIIPTDFIHIRIGVSPPPGVIVTIHAFPPQFPLAMTYIETLVSEKYSFEYSCRDAFESSKKVPVSTTDGATSVTSPLTTMMSSSVWRSLNKVIITSPTLLGVAEFIAGYIWRSDVPALMKEYVFHLLAQVLRILYRSETSISDILPTLTSQLSPLLSLHSQLKAELQQLYEDETKTWVSVNTATGTGTGLGVSDTGRFSTYFHTLMEAALAMAEVITPATRAIGLDSCAMLKESCSAPDAAIVSSPIAATSASKRKKVKVKRVRVLGPRRSSSPSGRLDDVDSQTTTSSSSSATSTTSSGTSVSVTKPEDMLWFHRALTMSKILRYLTTRDTQGQEVTSDAVIDAAQSLLTPTAHTRLLVMCGLPQSLDAVTTKKVIQKACNANGGLFKGELYLPTVDIAPSTSSQGNDSPTVSSGNELSSGLTKQVYTNRSGIKGYAVLELRSKSKVDSATRMLLESKSLLTSGTAETSDEVVDGAFSALSVLPVSAMLFTEAEGAPVIESYLLHKLVSNSDTYTLNPSALCAFTDIFHSCYITAHRLTDTSGQQESGYICLSKEQIMMQVVAHNTLHGTNLRGSVNIKSKKMDVGVWVKGTVGL